MALGDMTGRVMKESTIRKCAAGMAGTVSWRGILTAMLAYQLILEMAGVMTGGVMKGCAMKESKIRRCAAGMAGTVS